MAKLRGGLFGRPSGQVQNLVIGAARDRTGKVATARELVIPANPNSAAQQVQRGKFKDVLRTVRDIGPTEYQTYWNRGIGQLPGFQSLMSVLLRSINESYVYTDPPDVPLGTLHESDTLTIVSGGSAGQIAVTWSTENGSNGTANDKLHIFAILAARNADGIHPVKDGSASKVRSQATVSITGLTAGSNYLVYVFFEGVGTAAGLISPVRFAIVQAQAT